MVGAKVRLLVCGGRDFDDRELAFAVLDKVHESRGVSSIIHGGAKGADEIASEWAMLRGVLVEVFNPDWRRHRRGAGPRRNAQMIVDGKPDLAVAFPGGSGTRDMVRRLRAAHIEVIEAHPAVAHAS